jgi:biotin transport system substrate-specific component
MRTDYSSGSSLAPALWPSSVSPLVRNIVLILVGTGILTLSAKISVPFWPVPMTLQTFAIMFIAAAYGSRLAVATVLAYLAEGFIGIPVFAYATAGPSYFLGTTGGFLIGFLFAAAIVGWAADRGWDRSPTRLGAAMVVGDAIVFLLGFIWLAWFAHRFDAAGVRLEDGAGVAIAWQYGVANYLLGDALKIAIAALAVPAGWMLLDRNRQT